MWNSPSPRQTQGVSYNWFRQMFAGYLFNYFFVFSSNSTQIPVFSFIFHRCSYCRTWVELLVSEAFWVLTETGYNNKYWIISNFTNSKASKDQLQMACLNTQDICSYYTECFPIYNRTIQTELLHPSLWVVIHISTFRTLTVGSFPAIWHSSILLIDAGQNTW